jgi:hypothetical protein
MRLFLSGVSDQRGKIARMIAKGEIIGLRRGLYATRATLDPRGVAGAIYGPSYVSFETALSWHGMIPEGVREIVSATTKRPAYFENPLGRFRYLKVPAAVYPVGIALVTDADLPLLLAGPTKALCDRVAREPDFRSVAAVGRWLESARVEVPGELDHGVLARCAESYGRPALRWLLRYAEEHWNLTP